jgi:hypothetical protein
VIDLDWEFSDDAFGSGNGRKTPKKGGRGKTPTAVDHDTPTADRYTVRVSEVADGT